MNIDQPKTARGKVKIEVSCQYSKGQSIQKLTMAIAVSDQPDA